MLARGTGAVVGKLQALTMLDRQMAGQASALAFLKLYLTRHPKPQRAILRGSVMRSPAPPTLAPSAVVHGFA
jgi:hypothetical protein